MKISIITISYNAGFIIEKTIKSIINQTYKDIEYIIIDGGSNDETLDIIKKYSDRISYWVSEPDKGIYNAMNKGIDKATGEWINFMNAGDWFYNESVIADIFENKSYNYDIVYGAVERRTLKGNVISRPQAIENIVNNMIFSHQSTFVRTNLMKNHKFDESNYKIIADYAFFLKQWKLKTSFFEINQIVSSYDNITGISSSPTYSAYKNHLKERIKLENEFNLDKKYTKFYIFYCIRYKVKTFIYKLLGYK